MEQEQIFIGVNSAVDPLKQVSRKKEIVELVVMGILFVFTFFYLIPRLFGGVFPGAYLCWLFLVIVFNVLLFFIIRSQRINPVASGSFAAGRFVAANFLFFILSFMLWPFIGGNIKEIFSYFDNTIAQLPVSQTPSILFVTLIVTCSIMFLAIVNFVYYFSVNTYSDFSTSLRLKKSSYIFLLLSLLFGFIFFGLYFFSDFFGY